MFNRPVLIEAVKDDCARCWSAVVYLSLLGVGHAAGQTVRSGSATRPTRLPPSKEARQLMAAAGYANGLTGLDWLVRDGALTKLWAMAIRPC